MDKNIFVLKMLGPIAAQTQIFDCNSAAKFLAQVQSALNCLSGDHDHFQHYHAESLTDWLQNGSLHQTIKNMELLFREKELTLEQQKAAYTAFQAVTNYKQEINPINTDTQEQILELNSFYFFMTVGIIVIIIIWVIAISGAYSWATALFLTVFVFLFLYLFSIAYRKQGQNIINEERVKLENINMANQENLEYSIAHWLQGLLAAANAI